MAKVVSLKTPKFDPAINYKWEPEDEFTLLGGELGTMFQITKKLAISTQELTAQEKVTIYEILLNKIIQAVEQGVAVPLVEENVKVADSIPQKPVIEEAEVLPLKAEQDGKEN